MEWIAYQYVTAKNTSGMKMVRTDKSWTIFPLQI